MTSTGKIIGGAFGAAAVGITAVTIPFVSPGFRKICLPYVPATPKQISNVLESINKCSLKGPIIDLGSGDGRIVMALHKAGIEAHGLELNYWLVLYSRLKALGAVSSKKSIPRPKFIRTNLWKYNLSHYPTVVMFGTESLMELIAEKARNEMKSGSHLIACRFPLPDTESKWLLRTTVGQGIDSCWTYTKT